LMIPCSGGLTQLGTNTPAAGKPVDGKLEPQVDVPAPAQPGRYEIAVSLQYRKVDQFLLNFLLGATNQLTSPVTEIAHATASVEVVPAGKLTSVAHE